MNEKNLLPTPSFIVGVVGVGVFNLLFFRGDKRKLLLTADSILLPISTDSFICALSILFSVRTSFRSCCTLAILNCIVDTNNSDEEEELLEDL